MFVWSSGSFVCTWEEHKCIKHWSHIIFEQTVWYWKLKDTQCLTHDTAKTQIQLLPASVKFSSIWILSNSLWYTYTGVQVLSPFCIHALTIYIKKKMGTTRVHMKKKRKETVGKYLPKALWEFISLEIKKLKTVKEEPTTTKRGAKTWGQKSIYTRHIKQYGGHAGRQISEGDSSQNIEKGLFQFLAFLLPLIHGKGVYFIPKRKEEKEYERDKRQR